MFYVKNVPNWGRVPRIIMGMMALVFAAMNGRTSGLAMGAGIMGVWP